MEKFKGRYFKGDFDYEEDEYDLLKSKYQKKKDVFTNKVKMKKFEFDYEEDAYEPETWK